jgi:hypothetical protein
MAEARYGGNIKNRLFDNPVHRRPVTVGLAALSLLGAAVFSWMAIHHDPDRVPPEMGHQTDAGDLAIKPLQAWVRELEMAEKARQTSPRPTTPGRPSPEAPPAGAPSPQLQDPELLQTIVPDTLAGLSREHYAAARTTRSGIAVSQVTTRYGDADGAHRLDLEVTDLGGAQGFAALGSWATEDLERETDAGYERVHVDGERALHEQWDGATQTGSIEMIFSQRYSIRLSGTGFDLGELREFAGSLGEPGLAPDDDDSQFTE